MDLMSMDFRECDDNSSWTSIPSNTAYTGYDIVDIDTSTNHGTQSLLVIQ
jgi:hypothetical protein